MLASTPTLADTKTSVDPWTVLNDELDRWGAAGRTATVWWRDDDAIEPTAALETLLSLANKHRVPVGLAVVPQTATPTLANFLQGKRDIDVLQHGWGHINHAGSGAKKMELGDHRPKQQILNDLKNGFGTLVDLFGPRFKPVLVPPWNRMGGGIADALGPAGYRGISLLGARKSRHIGDVVLSNTHVDPIAWRGDRGFVGDGVAVTALSTHLANRRTHRVDVDEPSGLLTHHLVHDLATWDFIDRCLDVLAKHPCVRILPTDRVFDGVGP